jgi:hypothetical protein
MTVATVTTWPPFTAAAHIKRLAALGGTLLVAPIAAALLLRPGSGTQASPAQAAPSAAPAPAPTHPSFPAPPPGAVVFSRRLGSDALALGVVPQRGRVLLQASVLGPQGSGVSGLAADFTVQGARQSATPCGPGCYRATVATSGRPSSVALELQGGQATRWQVALPETWPPPDASALLARAGRVWRALRSLSFRESLASGPGEVVRSTWQMQAPDRLAYQVRGGWAAVIVGARRWDRSPGGARWVGSPQTPLTQPIPFWVSVRDAHVLGTGTVQGRPVWRVSFYDPATPAWFTVALDRGTLRTLELEMITTAHFMHDVYGSFDATPAIQPPR